MGEGMAAERMAVERYSTGTVWESTVGYCRAVKAGQFIFVSGTAPAAEGGGTFAPHDAYAQTKRCLAIIEQALQHFGADRHNVVRTRMFVTDMQRWSEYARGHQEMFGDCPPASTMVEIQGLVNEDMTIEIEVDAVMG